jgi:hypothetical protein
MVHAGSTRNQSVFATSIQIDKRLGASVFIAARPPLLYSCCKEPLCLFVKQPVERLRRKCVIWGHVRNRAGWAPACASLLMFCRSADVPGAKAALKYCFARNMAVHTVGDSSKEQVWIFGFGSLIWKAGRFSRFPFRLRADPSTECVKEILVIKIYIRVMLLLAAQDLTTANVWKATSRTTGAPP